MQARIEALLAALQSAEGLYSTVTAIVVYGDATGSTFALGESQHPPHTSHTVLSRRQRKHVRKKTRQKNLHVYRVQDKPRGGKTTRSSYSKGGVPYFVSRAYRAHHTIDTQQYTPSYTWRRQLTRPRSKTRTPRRLGGTFRDVHCDFVTDHASHLSKTHRCP